MEKKKQITLSLFDHLKHIITKQNKRYINTLNENNLKTFDIYMIQRFLSMNKDWIDVVAFMNKYCGLINKEQYYKMIISVIPRQNRYYYPYIKKNKNSKYEKWLTKYFVTYFQISEKEANEYIDILVKKGRIEELLEIIKKFGIDKKEIEYIENLKDAA